MGVVSLLILGGGVWLVMRNQPVQVQSSQGAVLGVGERVFDWGTIPLNGGEVTRSFEIENKGNAELQLANLKTSCMCTKARLIVGSEAGPWFAMHSQSQWVGKVPPGKKAQVEVVFDPAFHGPSGVGAIQRTVTMQTNDPNQSSLEFRLSANVVSQ
jgi:hypothetical protein